MAPTERFKYRDEIGDLRLDYDMEIDAANAGYEQALREIDEAAAALGEFSVTCFPSWRVIGKRGVTVNTDPDSQVHGFTVAILSALSTKEGGE